MINCSVYATPEESTGNNPTIGLKQRLKEFGQCAKNFVKSVTDDSYTTVKEYQLTILINALFVLGFGARQWSIFDDRAMNIRAFTGFYPGILMTSVFAANTIIRFKNACTLKFRNLFTPYTDKKLTQTGVFFTIIFWHIFCFYKFETLDNKPPFTYMETHATGSLYLLLSFPVIMNVYLAYKYGFYMK